MLNKEQIIEKIKQVLPAIELYNITKDTNHYSNEIVETMIEVWEKGIVFTTVSRGCSGCIKHVSDVIFSYSEREGIVVDAPVISIEPIAVVEAPAKKKRATKKK
jgi:hypothetical protein